MDKQFKTSDLVWEKFIITLGDRAFKLFSSIQRVLPVARKLGEIIKEYAAKLRPYLNKALGILDDSLDNYSQVLTSICEGSQLTLSIILDENPPCQESLKLDSIPKLPNVKNLRQ